MPNHKKNGTKQRLEELKLLLGVQWCIASVVSQNKDYVPVVEVGSGVLTSSTKRTPHHNASTKRKPHAVRHAQLFFP